MKDTPPEVNARLFEAMMRKTPGERLLMGFDMFATARALVWSRIPDDLSDEERAAAFFEAFYGESLPTGVRFGANR